MNEIITTGAKVPLLVRPYNFICPCDIRRIIYLHFFSRDGRILLEILKLVLKIDILDIFLFKYLSQPKFRDTYFQTVTCLNKVNSKCNPIRNPKFRQFWFELNFGITAPF